MKKILTFCLLNIALVPSLQPSDHEHNNQQRYIKTYNEEGKDKRLEKLPVTKGRSLVREVTISAGVIAAAAVFGVIAGALKSK